jgi:alkylation response protein AidB-like acyl-CoA dehydrogenase
MDFSLSPEQEALRDLAGRILADRVTPERLRALEASGEWFDQDLWAELARARLVGLAVPEAHGGSGLGLLEICLLLEQVGRAVAPVPLLAALVLGGLPLAEFGTREQQARWLPPLASGESLLTAALVEAGNEEPGEPAVSACRDGAEWRLDGVKVCVPAGHLVERILVPARTGDGGVGVFLVDPRGSGVTMERQIATSREPQQRLALTGARVASDGLLGDPRQGRAIVAWIVERARLGLAATQLGVADRALRMTAEYTTKREQFGRPIASFQAVQQRAADAYIDVQAIRLTLWQAVWRLEAGLPGEAEVAVAKFWATEAAHRVVYAAQHLHGGIGVDVDYPLHRYYLWAKQLELTLGSGMRQLTRLGALLARS